MLTCVTVCTAHHRGGGGSSRGLGVTGSAHVAQDPGNTSGRREVGRAGAVGTEAESAFLADFLEASGLGRPRLSMAALGEACCTGPALSASLLVSMACQGAGQALALGVPPMPWELAAFQVKVRKNLNENTT